MDLNNAIGINGQLLSFLPKDLARFKRITEGENKAVVMGRKTLESLPNGKPLPNRTNIVVTRDESFTQEGVTAMCSLDLLRAQAFILEVINGVEIFVIGGGEIYRELLPDVDTIYVTQLHHKFKADTYFPKIDMSEWEVTEESEIQNEGGLEYQYITYERIDNHAQQKIK